MRVVGGLETNLAAVPVAAHVADADLTAGRQCVVAYLELSDPRSAVVVGVVGTTAGGGGGATTHWARRAGAEIFLPAAAGPVAVTSGAAWTFGGWTAIGTPAADFYLSQLMAFLSVVPATLAKLLVEFGYGAGPAALDATRLETCVVDPTADASGWLDLSTRSRPTRVPAGAAVSARAWSSRAADVFDCMVVGWSGSYPVWSALPSNTVVGPGRYYPTNVSTAGVAVVAGAWGAWGAPVAVVAAAPNGLLVTQVIQLGVMANVLSTGVAYQLGFGPAGSETWCATVLTAHAGRAPWIWPPVWVQAGERLAVRAQGNAAGLRQCLVRVHDM